MIEKIEQQGSAADNIVALGTKIKRLFLKEAVPGSVLSIGQNDDISTLDLQNVNGVIDTVMQTCREAIATAADMPASCLNHETFAAGFGEGTEDAKKELRFYDSVREQINPLFAFFDEIIMRLSWTPEFIQSVRERFRADEINGKTLADLDDEAIFREWKESFIAKWPNLLQEPESEKVKIDDVKLKIMTNTAMLLMPQADETSKAAIIDWMQASVNNSGLFSEDLTIDAQVMAAYQPPNQNFDINQDSSYKNEPRFVK
jgi:hypothetical protein